MTLKTYFNVIIAFIMVSLFIVITSFTVSNSKAFMKNQLAEQTELLGLTLVQSISQSANANHQLLTEQVSQFSRLHQYAYIRVQHLDKTFIEKRATQPSAMPKWLANYLSVSSPLFQQSFALAEQEYMVQLQLQASPANNYIYGSFKDVCAVFTFFICFAWFILHIAIRALKAPIDALHQHTNKLANKEFTEAPEIQSVSEMNALMSSHNRMTNQVKELVNELTQRLEHAKNALYRDELTQLGNRRLFCAQFEQLLSDEKNQSGALILVRLSEWETVRRKEGFSVARSFLEDVIYTLQTHSKQGVNARIFRLNDNEFACVLQHVTRDELVNVLSDMASHLARLQGQYQQKKEVLVGAVLWQSGEAMPEVMKAADEAVLIAAKERRKYHLYEPSQHMKKVSDMLATRERVLMAISESTLGLSQHSVMMSDQVSLMFSEVLTKITFQDEVIPTLLLQSKAEQFSASGELDKRIFNLIRSWYVKGQLDLPVSINVSVHSVLDDTFYAWLTEQAHQFADLFTSIIWEFDEQMLSQSQLAPQVISKLHKLGSKVAIDHFGTGDNTLLALRKWPVDIVKLDGSFIRELEQKQDSWYFLENIIKLAHSLGVVVVCEQLESEEQVKWAQQLGSDGFQGFKLALPHAIG
ncbi:putative membrane protein YjcC [Pseudoalteromonas sp. P1-9]|nr:putative membrane protein YjcC [Pseudoalteromonas sp. P1-9]